MMAAIAAAQDEPAADVLWDKSLQELLEIKLVTPTAQEQRAAESPAVVSVLTAQQIRDLGVTTLYEALNYLPGVLVTETYFGYSAVNVRGLLQTHYNNKVLLLINGHPSREVVNGSFHLELIPIEAVERIEFVRGPGSSLYGTNAFAGVINIITKKGSDSTSRQVTVGGGSFGTIEGSLLWGTSSDTLDVMVAVGTRNDDGYPYRVDNDENGNHAVLDYENDVTNAMASLEVGDFTITAAGFHQRKMKFGITPVVDYTGPSRYEGGFFDVLWTHDLNDEMTLNARVRYDELDRSDSEVHSFPYDGFLGHENSDVTLNPSGSLFGAELSLAYTSGDWGSLLGGVVYEKRDADPYLFRFADDGSVHPFTAFAHSPSADDISVFGQGLFELGQRLEAVVGFRFNDDSDAGSSFVPRLGLVYELSENTFLKALYAEAYRTPDFFEKEVETYNVLYGDAALEPERTRNFDLAIDTALGASYNLRVNAFYLTTSDLIVRVPTDDPETMGENAAVYTNGGGENIWGLEAALMAQPSDKMSLFVNYSWREGEDKDSGADSIYIANHTVSTGLVWKPLRKLHLKPNLQYAGERGAVDDYTLVNLVVSVPLTNSLSLELIGRNLGDEEYVYPEYVRGILAGTPGGPERSGFVRLHWKY
jgi:iron complex outermembrane receptor protein